MEETQTPIQTPIQFEQPTQLEKPRKKNFLAVLGWVLLAILLVIIYFLIQKCNLKPAWLAPVLLADYLLLLIINRINLFKKNRWFFSLFLTLMPVLAVVMTSSWSFWFWALAIILYLITLLQYFLKTLDDNAWSVIIPLTLFLALLIFKLQRFMCSG